MSTVAQLVDRVYREWLSPAREAPVLTRLDGDMDADDLTLVWQAFPAPEDEYAMTTGVVIQLERELCWVAQSDTQTRTSTVVRGYQGTTPAAHGDNAWLEISPQWPWITVFESVCDEVADLFPMLYGKYTETVTADEPFHALDTPGLEWVLSATDPGGYPINSNFRPHMDDGAAAVLFPNWISTDDYTITFARRIERPSHPDDELGTLGVEPSWERIAGLGAAAYLVGAADLDRAALESVTESIESETTPVGSYAELQTRLWRLRDYLMVRAHDSLMASSDISTHLNRVI